MDKKYFWKALCVRLVSSSIVPSTSVMFCIASAPRPQVLQVVILVYSCYAVLRNSAPMMAATRLRRKGFMSVQDLEGREFESTSKRKAWIERVTRV